MIRGDFYDTEHEAYRAAWQSFVEREVRPRQPDWEQAGIVDKETWRLAGKQNLLCPWADPEFGGLGLTDLRYEQIAIEELARVGESGFAVPLHSGVVAPYLAEFGSVEQKQRLLTGAVSGERVLALAITEPGAGSDVAGVRTRAVADGDEWVLNGAKTFISSGVNADTVVVAARTGEGHQLGLFLVHTGMPGFSRGRKLDKLGLRTQDTAELFFDDVRLTGADVLGDPAQGFSMLMNQFALERLIVAIGGVAAAEAALAETVRYARERTAFGRTLTQFQDTRFRLAAMRAEISSAQAFVDRCVLAYNDDRLTADEAAQAKLVATETQGRVVDDCLQMFGGYGYMWEYPICRMYADARIQRIYGGTSEIMKEIISRSMDL
ncbi:acyl-CoA dehydrogenase [Krasilnikovia cinnamomea]|uniref:Acyl-CoA dehydrogenase n=1 Tax=Krasilnikovia cinnamomea TaxID=349313 RepID=A0A4Q7ZKB6_9ACTN|nr:acyl-CoA dehydrogenase family protein [Krasilnikovia cinnamomea]RZU51372.1 acyl-CoA dehydrogenase [Krasilnikovia cinnamomea]